MKLTFDNAMAYNLPTSKIFKWANELKSRWNREYSRALRSQLSPPTAADTAAAAAAVAAGPGRPSAQRSPDGSAPSSAPAPAGPALGTSASRTTKQQNGKAASRKGGRKGGRGGGSYAAYQPAALMEQDLPGEGGMAGDEGDFQAPVQQVWPAPLPLTFAISITSSASR